MLVPPIPSLPSRAELSRNLLAAFASPFSQNNRLFTMRFSPDSRIEPDLLLPHRLRGVEKIFSPYLYQIEALSSNAYLSHEKFLGQPVQLAILLSDGSERIIAGVVTSFGQQNSDGGLSRYVLHIEPCLAVFAHNYNACIRQDKTVDQVLLDVLNYHIQNNAVVARSFRVELRLTNKLPTLSYTTQHESDLHYLERLMAQYGLFYFFEFRNEDGHPVHVMVISDDQYRLPSGIHPKLRFGGANDTDDTMTQWSSMRRIQPGMVSLTSFEYKNVSVDSANAESRIDHGKTGNQLAATLHDFAPQTHYYARGGDALQRHARIRQEAYDFQTQEYTGVTSDRSAAVATVRQLQNHPVHDQQDPEQRKFVIVTLVCEAENNLTQQGETALASLLRPAAKIPESLAPWFGNGQSLLTDPQQQPYSNIITCVQRDVPIRPRYAHTDYAKPVAPVMVTATVIGPPGEEIYTDEYGRVQVEYHYESVLGNRAPGSAGQSTFRCWVRVLCMAAGQHWGSQFIPRVNQEVAILFVNGDPDRMLCIGVLPNGTHVKPLFWNEGQLPNNKTQSGFKSKENQGNGYNQLLLDDTTQQLSAHLATTHAHTQLNQGWLGTARRDGKSDPRGEGLELITEAAGAIRTGGPLLLTTEQQRPGDPQLKRDLALQVMAAALALVERQSDFAAEVEANQIETGRGNMLVEGEREIGHKADTGHQTHLKEALFNLERGYNNDLQGKTGEGQQRGGQGIIALSSVDGTAMTSQKSITAAAGTNLDQVALRDTNQTSGRRWIHNVGESISLFVDGSKAKIKNTVKITAAKGNMLLRVLTGQYVVEANGDIIHRTKGKYIVEAGQGVWIKGEGGLIHVGNNIDIHNPGMQSQKAADFALDAGASGDVGVSLPKGTPTPCKMKMSDAAASGSPAVER